MSYNINDVPKNGMKVVRSSLYQWLAFTVLDEKNLEKYLLNSQASYLNAM